MPSIPDKNGIITALTDEEADVTRRRRKEFGAFAIIYDFMLERFTRPRVHKADPQQHREVLANLIAPVQQAKVLDVACGTGGAIAHFHESNDYTGLDISYGMLKQAVKKAQRKSFNACRFIQGNAEQLIFNDESFDFVMMDTALHMIPNYQLAITEIARVLVNDGTFMCSTPAVGINREFDVTWEKISAKYSLHSLTVPDIENACQQAGLCFQQCDANGGILYFQAYKGRQSAI